MIVHDMPLTKTIILGNTPINIICRKGTVALFYSSHSQALHSFISSLDSSCHTVRNLPPAQAKDFHCMGPVGKNMACIKVIMAGLKCYPLHSFQDMGRHLPVHRECLQDHWEIIQSIRHHLPAQLLHLNLLPRHLGDTPYTSQGKDSSRQRNRRKQMARDYRLAPIARDVLCERRCCG
jgi:hypothetical protein